MEAALHAALGGGGARLLDLAGPHAQRRGRPARPVARGEPGGDGAPGRRRARRTRAPRSSSSCAGCLNGFTEEEIDFLSTMSLLADRPVNWNVLGVSAMNPDGAWSQLAAGTAAAARGATVVALTLPHTMQLRLSFEHGAILDGLPGWREVFALPVAERMAALSDPATRRRLDAGAQSDEAGHPAAPGGVGPPDLRRDVRPGERRRSRAARVGEVARDAGPGRPSTRSLDVVVADGLRTGPAPAHRRVRGGLGAAGRRPGRTRGPSSAAPTPAPTSTPCAAPSTRPPCWATACGPAGLLSWEQAVRQLTDVPARLYGLRDRGRLVPGAFADVVVFDPTTIGHGAVRTRDDLPGGASRLYAEAVGIGHVLVNGTEIVRDGAFTGAVPGQRAALGTRHRHRARRVGLGGAAA